MWINGALLICMVCAVNGKVCRSFWRCTCTMRTISCINAGLSNVPYFTAMERVGVQVLNMKYNKIGSIRADITREKWPKLKVSFVICSLQGNLTKCKLQH